MIGETELTAMLQEPIAALGYELSSVKINQNKGSLSLNIVVDRDAPISLDDIVIVSDAISALLDEKDPFEDPYTLDVSSSGAEKAIPVDHLDKYVGRYVNLHLTHPIAGENYVEGDILGLGAENLKLLLIVRGKKKEIDIPLAHIDRARLAIKF